MELVKLIDGKGNAAWVLLNHSMEPQTVTLPGPATDILDGETSDEVQVEPLGVRWLRLGA